MVEIDNITCNWIIQIFLKFTVSSYIVDSIARARLPFQKPLQKTQEQVGT